MFYSILRTVYKSGSYKLCIWVFFILIKLNLSNIEHQPLYHFIHSRLFYVCLLHVTPMHFLRSSSQSVGGLPLCCLFSICIHVPVREVKCVALLMWARIRTLDAACSWVLTASTTCDPPLLSLVLLPLLVNLTPIISRSILLWLPLLFARSRFRTLSWQHALGFRVLWVVESPWRMSLPFPKAIPMQNVFSI